jgi:hypothetical protein
MAAQRARLSAAFQLAHGCPHADPQIRSDLANTTRRRSMRPRRRSGPSMRNGKVVRIDLFTRCPMCQDGACGLPYSPRPTLSWPRHWVSLRRGLFLWAANPMTADERRLLELLAASDDGCTDVLLLAHGLPIEMIAEVVRAGLAVAHPGRLLAGRVLNTRLLITDAGRRALAGQ